MVVFGSVSGDMGRLDEAVVPPWLYDPAPNQTVTGFNLGPWFELRLPTAISALQRLVEWVTTGQVHVPVSRVLTLADAAQAHRLLETGATTCKVVLKP